jgi:hypothetical protein
MRRSHEDGFSGLIFDLLENDRHRPWSYTIRQGPGALSSTLISRLA